MANLLPDYDVIVVGAGHAGCDLKDSNHSQKTVPHQCLESEAATLQPMF